MFPPAEARRSGQEPTVRMRFPEMTTAPLLMGGRETGRTVRARRIMVESFAVEPLNRRAI
jgi:hypothetical protein